MRPVVVAMAIGALALAAAVVPGGPASADKSKLGCDRETEVWNATAGRCETGTPKWKRKPAAEPVVAPEPAKGKAKAKAKAKAKGKAAPAAK